MPKKYPSMAERIIANTTLWPGPLDTECWLWHGATNGRYGKLSVRFKRGPRKGKVKTCVAHRVAWEAFNHKRLNTRDVVQHKCHVMLCCNPKHLIGHSTIKANNRATVKAGRHRNMYTKEKS